MLLGGKERQRIATIGGKQNPITKRGISDRLRFALCAPISDSSDCVRTLTSPQFPV